MNIAARFIALTLLCSQTALSAFAADPDDPIIFQSRNTNYELLVREGDGLRHYWFDFRGDRNWRKGELLGSNVQSGPVAFVNRTNGNYEVFVREGDHLQHYWFDYARERRWKKGAAFASNVQSSPAVFQSHSGNYEVVVREGDHLQHYWWDPIADRRWKTGGQFGSDVQSAPAAFANSKIIGGRLVRNYEVVVREGDGLRHYWWSFDENLWKGGEHFASKVASDPVMFQGANGNYEVMVREGDRLRHYWFAFDRDERWHQGALVGERIRSSPAMFQNIRNQNYELVVREDDHLQHYWLDYAAGLWKRADVFGSNVRGGPSVFPNQDIVREEDEGWLGPTRFIPSGNYELVVREEEGLRHYWFDYDRDKRWYRGALLPR